MYVRVHVIPGAKKERVSRTDESTFDISVREPAARNLANRRVVEIVAAEFGVSGSNVRIVSGHRSPHKVISLEHEHGVSVH